MDLRTVSKVIQGLSGIIFLTSLGKNVESEPNQSYKSTCITATGQITFGEGLKMYAIRRDNHDLSMITYIQGS